MTDLFSSGEFGAISVANRIFMAPLTRARATRDAVPTPRMVEYYRQRASAGLIISEATGISRAGLGFPFAPGLWNAAQIEGWKPVTEAVHTAGGRIIAQLWHMGRLVHPDFLVDCPSGSAPVSASATTAPGHAHTYHGNQPYAQARAATQADIAAIVADYGRAARHAMAAGFDGVQLHAANGYLIDQFLRDGANLRDDAYGGTVENRMRLLLEVLAAIIAEAGAARTAVRFSPNGDVQGVIDSAPEALFTRVAEALSPLNLAFVELREQRDCGQPPVSSAFRQSYRGKLVLNQSYTPQGAREAVAAGAADAIAFGRAYIANPDLVTRIKADAGLNKALSATFYTQGDEGYLDYPTLDQAGA